MSVRIAKTGRPDRTRRFTIVELTQATGQGTGTDADEAPSAAK
jgi:hypothetical protein